MNVLVLASDVPATAGMPGSPRLFSLCEGLSRRHRLTLATFVNDHAQYEAFCGDPAVPTVFEDIVVLPNPPAPGWWGQQVHRLRQEAHFATRVRNRPYYDDLRRTLRNMVREGRFDIIYVDGLSSTQYVLDANLPCAAAVDLHDCVSLLYARNMRVERNWLMKVRLFAESRSIARWESKLSGSFGAVITNSPVDEAFLKELDPAANTLTIGNGVDTGFFSASGETANVNKLVFTGVMDYGPNEDAVRHFADAVLPLIRAKYPDVEFEVVGKDPTSAVLALASRPGISVLGEVPDVRPFVRGAGIFVCPLRYGTGVKNKLLAALSMERPVVATRQSMDGLELRENVDLLIADDPRQFASKVMQLMADPTYAARLAESGRAFVTARYSWTSSADELESTLIRLVRSRRRTEIGANAL
jgi:glycosyltransferase involved in cell wall biosynthesis